MRYESELYHHGILGQKWGHQNGPPYPLDSEDHSTSEKKAGWRKSVSGKSKAYKKSSKEEKKEFETEYSNARESAYSRNNLDKIDKQIEESYNEGDVQRADELQKEFDRVQEMSTKEARDYMISKYGEDYVKSYEDYDRIATAATGTAAYAVGLGLTVASIYGEVKLAKLISNKVSDLGEKVVEEIMKKVLK